MTELALSVLDISNNSIRAEATRIDIAIIVDTKADTIVIEITDDGKGMTPEFLSSVTKPFVSTKPGGAVGMGIPLFKADALKTGGSFDITSKLGEGTKVKAVFGLSHADRPPLGDLAATMAALICVDSNIDFFLDYSLDGDKYHFDTVEIKEILNGVDVTSNEVIIFLKQFIRENLSKLNGGKIL